MPGGKDPNQIFFREQGDDRRLNRYWTGNHAQSFNSYLLGGNYRLKARRSHQGKPANLKGLVLLSDYSSEVVPPRRKE